MDSTDKDLKKTSNIEQMALIGKMHNMQWLKSNSQFSGHTKTLPDGKDINNTFKSKINEGTKEKSEISSTNTVSNSPELDEVDLTSNKDINEDDSIINKDSLQSSLKVVDFSEKSMETVWNKDVNVTSTMYPNSQSLVMQRLDKQEMISMSLAENIVTVQLEQFRLNEEERNKPDELHNEVDNEWDNVHHNMSDSQKSDSEIGNQVSPKQCHDNNNNNAKSKSQSPLETKKSIQKTTTKISTKKLSDQKIKKQAGSSLKESCAPSKQGSKSKDNLLNLCNDSNITSTSTDSKKITVGTSPRLIDQFSKIHGYSKNLIMGKGPRMKEQQFFKQHFSTLNDSGNRSRSSVEGIDEKSKSVTTRFKSVKNESDRRNNEVEDTKKCHKVHVTRTQSYNVQYNRNKPLIKSQQRYLRNATKPEEDGSINTSSGFNNNISMSNSTENVSKKKCENQQPVINKQISDIQSNQSTSGKNTRNSNVPECSINERSSVKSNSVPCKRNYQNLPNTKNTTERSMKDDQVYTQKFKKDSNVYRRSSGVLQTFFKDINGKGKPDDHKRNVTDNNFTKDYRVNRISSVDTKVRSQSEGSRISVYPHKTSNGASNVNKTDTLDSTTVNNVQSLKSLNSCSSSTKDSTIINASTHTSQESQVLQASCNETEVQFVKTEQENTSNNNSNNKTSASNSETKSVKFSDNVQEFNMAHHSTTSYSDNSIHQTKLPANSYYSDLQNPSNTNNAQQIENHQIVQNKNYFDDNNAQYNNTTTNIQNTERDLHLLDVVHHKPEQTSHMSPQNMLPHNCNPTIAMGNGLPYQNMPAVYLNQYNNAQTIPRKTADSTIISQNPLIPSTSSYTIENQNVMQTDPSILMHNTQTSVLPPPGFHNHPVTTQPNQWNLPLLDMYLFGNVMNHGHPLNMPIQNSRHMCNTDFNNIQQTGYLQHPMYYVPSMCMQGWNSMVQYPAPPFQNPTYTNCSTYPNQVLPTNTLTDSMNCSVPTSMQNNPYKHFQQMQPMENPPNFSVPVKLDNYIGNMQGCNKSNNVRMKNNTMDVHMRASQYRVPVPNEYQNCSQDPQLMVPFPYTLTMDSIARNGPSNMLMQVNQKYAPCALTTANYPRMPETCTVYHNNQDSNNRKDDITKNESECLPPMVSPRECMYYGVNYSRKNDTIQNSFVRSDMKPVSYVHSVNSQHYVPQYQKNATYHASQKELASNRVTVGRGLRKTMDQ
ncbi:hypothetical protein WH47_06303 [Habropoda laboriosa]|uniref:Uncharacterized protein n=1 Tax=Habropoda laboriosa TaxID=597456 RepID=A0A0L7RC04_9HYME|nr:PREDICTED: probable serine/threonine-protein kinase DDB_G0282963 [Habropoda laboriosa]KOC68512.1 hypothetical protein WH47_06303 [Habropoda laboriosa]